MDVKKICKAMIQVLEEKCNTKFITEIKKVK